MIGKTATKKLQTAQSRVAKTSTKTSASNKPVYKSKKTVKK